MEAIARRARARALLQEQAQRQQKTVREEVRMATELGDWSRGWPGGEKGLKGWVEALELDSAASWRLLSEYDPERLAQMMSAQPGRVNSRAVEVISALVRFASSLLLDRQTGKLALRKRQRARELRETLARLGPSFIKVGQTLSARPDICPPEYLQEFATLQDSVPSFPTPLAHALIEQELGRRLEDMFIELTPEPVAAASLGQVYRGVLRETGERVAVKVQRPGIGESIALDMFLVRKAASWIDANLDVFSTPLVPLVDEFARRLFGELDYVQEGHHAERFQELYGGLPRIRTPRIYWAYTARRVLVMEWIEGCKLTDQNRMARMGLSITDLVDVGIECSLRQLLEHGYFHADPHPGNLLAMASGELCYLDFGMMSEAPQAARYALMEHIVHLVNRDYEAMALDYYKLDFLSPEVDTSPIVPALAGFFDTVLDKSVAELNFKSIVDGLGEVLYAFPFNVPAYYALILRSLTVLEGIAMYSDPDYKLLAKAYPYIARRLLTDPAPELRSALEDLVLKDGSFRWNRLENLLREGRKSAGFDDKQLWTLLHWLVSGQADSVRKPLLLELVRQIDAMGYHSTRQVAAAVTRTFGRLAPEDAATLTDRWLPFEPEDKEAYARAQLLGESVAEASRARQNANAKSSASAIPVNERERNANPMQAALQVASSVPNTVANLREEWDKALPQLQRLMAEPGAAQFLADIGRGVLGKMTARAMKILLRRQEQGNGSDN